MLYGDPPPSFTGGGESNPQIHFTGDGYSQPPSHGVLGHAQSNSHTHFPPLTSNRGLDHHQTPAAFADHNTKAPSFSDFVQPQGIFSNNNGNRSLTGNVSDPAGKPLSISAMVKGTVSEKYSGGVDRNKDVKAAPNLSGVDRRGGPSATSNVEVDDPDEEDLVGISLVGKNFRKFYPNAYYKDREDEK